MSAELYFSWRIARAVALVAAAIALMITAAGTVFARDMVDPWLVRPPVLDTGVILPGDDGVVPCALTYDPGAVLTLPFAVDLALCQNASTKSAWASIKVQSAALGEARAAYLPTINGSFSRVLDHTTYPNSNFPSTTLKSNTMYGNLSWRLFDFGGRDASNRSAAALLEAALANNDAVLQKTLTLVIGAYSDAQSALVTLQIRRKNEDLAQQTVQAAQRREKRGFGSQSDTLQAMTALAKATLGRGRADGDYRKALAVLIYMTGLPAGTPLSLPDDLQDEIAHVREDLNDWLSQAQAHHPAIIAAKAQLTSAQERVKVVRSEGLPTLDMTASFYQNGRPNQGLTPSSTREALIGIAVNIPLFDGFSNTYKVRGAQAQVEQKRAEFDDVQRQTLMDVVKSHADATMALTNLEASRNLLETAQAALKSVQRKFDLGAADILEMLNSQSALLDAQQERIRCQVDWRAARLRLLASAGMLGRSGVVGGTPR